MNAPVKEHPLKATHRWRRQVLASLAELRPVVAELEAMLAEARIELAALEKAERLTSCLEYSHRPAGQYTRKRRKRSASMQKAR